MFPFLRRSVKSVHEPFAARPGGDSFQRHPTLVRLMPLQCRRHHPRDTWFCQRSFPVRVMTTAPQNPSDGGLLKLARITLAESQRYGMRSILAAGGSILVGAQSRPDGQSALLRTELDRVNRFPLSHFILPGGKITSSSSPSRVYANDCALGRIRR